MVCAAMVLAGSAIVAERCDGTFELPELEWAELPWRDLSWPDPPWPDPPWPDPPWPDPPWGGDPSPGSMDPPSADDRLLVASFNVKFLGYYPERDAEGLADLLADYDVVLVQEVVAPPYPGRFPGGEPYRPDPESRAFFDAMQARGFAFELSLEDTGRGETNRNNSAATEWFAAFYRPQRISPAKDLPHGYLTLDRTAHPDFDRVPHAFSFRTRDGGPDFVLISVHLHADARGWQRRRDELAAIARWVDRHDGVERDFVIMGDMNVQDCAELDRVTPPGFVSLNDDCMPTNTLGAHRPAKGRPYDHVMLRPEYASEVDFEHGMKVIDLVAAMEPRWAGPGRYPGSPYRHDEFISRYSDHHPVVFAIRLDVPDDDGREAILTRATP
jgi:endonuclease/exonuclease/phosphatase family metal-dependent hydrolase